MPKSIRHLYRKDRKIIVQSKHPVAARFYQFRKRICGDIDIKKHLNERQNGLCEVCDTGFIYAGLEDTTVHHLSYDHECSLAERSNVFSPIPCGVCLQKHEKHADECLSRVVLLHSKCHDKLHQAEKRDPEWANTVGWGAPDDDN